MATVNRCAGVDFPVFYLNQKVRLARRVDIDKWIESRRRFSSDGAATDRVKNRRARPTAGASTPELDAEQDEALRAYERFMES